MRTTRVSMRTEYRTTGRILELDALRGIAALGVVFWHYGAHFDAHPLAWMLRPFYNAGFLLVDFFFVLSGYVIARAYWNERRQSHAWRNIWARIARLYPLHLLTLLVTVALVLSLPPGATDVDFNQPHNDIKHLVLNLLLINQVGLQDGWSFNIPAWSISTEFVVNVAFLTFIAMSVRLRWICTAAVMAVATVLFAVLRPPVLQGQMAFGVVDVNLLRCMLGFGAGVGVYLAVHRFALGRRLAAATRVSEVIGLAALVGLVGLMVASGRHPPIRDYLLSIAFSIGCVVFIPSGRLLKSVLGWRPLVFLGDISYSIYLVHYPLQLALYSLAARGVVQPDYDSPGMLLLYAGCVVGVAAITHRQVELPAQARLLAWTAPRPQPA
jgi:peptidoglycan/LPS O-acetylase OafA/YrhL